MDIAGLRRIPRFYFRLDILGHATDGRTAVRGHRSDHVGPDLRHLDNVLVGHIQMGLYDDFQRGICQTQGGLSPDTRPRVRDVRRIRGRPVRIGLYEANDTNHMAVHVFGCGHRGFTMHNPDTGLSEGVE